MDMERRGRHTQATGIIQLLNKEEDMMKEAKPFVIDPKVMSMNKELSVKSRVMGDFHARFCERVRVKLPRSTRPMTLFYFHFSVVMDFSFTPNSISFFFIKLSSPEEYQYNVQSAASFCLLTLHIFSIYGMSMTLKENPIAT